MPRRDTPTLEVAVTRYLSDRSVKYGKSIMAIDRSLLFRFSQWYGSTRRVGTITSEDVASWLQTFIDQDRAPGTVNRYRIRIRTFNRWCLQNRFTTRDWLESFDSEADPPRDFVFLSPDQLLSLLPAARHPRDRCMLAIGMNTAMRVNEIIKLTVNDVDLENNRLRMGVSKQKARRRVVTYKPLTTELRSELTRWIDYYTEEQGKLDPTWYLTPAKYKDHLVGPGLAEPGRLHPTSPVIHPWRIARAAYARAGIVIPRGEAWHVLRRSVARIYFDSRMDSGDPYAHALRRTAALLNHKSTQTTERYLGFSADREAVDRDLMDQPFLSLLGG